MPATLSKVKPGLPQPMPSDTTVPGLARRHIWAAPDVTSHSLLVLTLPRLYLTPASGDLMLDRVATIEKTYDLEATLGPLATAIEMSSIQRVRLDLIQNTLRIDHTPARGGQQRSELVFAKPEVADTVFSKIWRRLGAEFLLRPYRPESWDLMRTPLLVMVGLACSTAALSFALNGLADIYGGTDWVTAGVLPGWRTIAVTGGAAVAAAHIWLYRRITQPPERLELVRT